MSDAIRMHFHSVSALLDGNPKRLDVLEEKGNWIKSNYKIAFKDSSSILTQDSWGIQIDVQTRTSFQPWAEGFHV